MCRWIAYLGPPILLAEVLTRPDHSLIDQSVHAREGTTSNGDGFGVGWYADASGIPGRYRDTHPAWNDSNLQQLAAHIRSGLFMAHVRAATGTPVQDTNCHPFAWRHWLFQHNGSVPRFERLKRHLLLDVDPALFPHIEGSTDSEILFFLALTLGLNEAPQTALERTAERVERALRETDGQEPLTFSIAASDGRRLFAVRYATDDDAPTLYCSRHLHALRSLHGAYRVLPEGAVIVVSEPLDEMTEHWDAVPESSFVAIEDGVVTFRPFVASSGSG